MNVPEIQPDEWMPVTEDFTPVVILEPELRVVRLEELPPNEKLLSPEPSTSFRKSVETVGVNQPIVLVRAAGGYKVCAGRRRIKAARSAGLETIPASIYPESYMMSEVFTLVENEQRTNNYIAALDSLEVLFDQGLSQEQIFELTGMHKATMYKILGLQNLKTELRQALIDGKIKQSAAFRASKLSEEKQLKLIDVLEEEGTIKVAHVSALTRVAVEANANSLPDTLFDEIPGMEEALGPFHPAPQMIEADRIKAAIASLEHGASRPTRKALQQLRQTLDLE